MIFGRKRSQKKKEEESEETVEVISATIDDVRYAVNQFAKEQEKGISLRSIILATQEIDFELLHPYLGGKPDKPFYMSKETFEIFEEPDYPRYIDYCQIACDQYFLETGEEPVIPGDRFRKISYFKLQNYLIDRPPFDLYLDAADNMVTHRKPDL